MRAGELRDRVTIEVPSQKSDGHDGFERDKWAPVLPRRRSARVAPLEGRSLERARQIDPRAGHEVAVRYWAGWSQSFTKRARIVFHDGSTDRVLEPIEPPREIEPRETLAVACREAA